MGRASGPRQSYRAFLMPSSSSAPISIEIHPAATDAEREAIYRFRYDIYVREMGKVRLPQADHGREWLKDENDDQATVYGAYTDDGAVVGTVQVLGGESAIPEAFTRVPHFDQFLTLPARALSFTSRLMVAPGRRGGQAMTALVGRAYSDGLKDGHHFNFCTCVPGLVDLYEHLGYRRFSGNLVDPVVGYQVPLVLAAHDREHLAAIQSPLWRHLRAYPEDSQRDQEAQRLLAWLNESVPVTSLVRDWVEQEDTFWLFLADKVRSAASDTASILADLSENEQRRLLRGGTVLDCARGDQIIKAGAVGTEIFVVLHGLVEVRLPGQDAALAVLDTGQVFGEIAFITDITRTADVIALTEARLLVLSQSALKRLVITSPALAAKLMFNLSRVLCERLISSNRRAAGGGEV